MMSSSTNRDRGYSEAQLTEEEFAARLSAPDPRMAGLSLSNDVLRNSLPVAPPWSLRKWVDERTGGSLRKLERLQLSGVDWLVARKPWQRWTLSLGLGVAIGLGIVFSGPKFFRGGLQSASAVASGMPTAEVVAAVRPSAVTPSAVTPSAEAASAQAPSAVEVPVATAVADAPVVAEEAPAAAPEPSDDDASSDAVPEKPGKHGKKKKGRRSRSHHRAQADSNPLKQAAAAAAFKLAQPAPSKVKRSKRTKATASF
ncbi:MAG TPA: hypothetical protein VFS67_05410 [Polyangiaceae bacterium]|nr:hypothetical protein [Polyangiaceae bacterium]